MIEFTIPSAAPSTPNLREHWAAKAKRVKAQRAAVARKMPAWSEGPLLVVRLTRVAQRSLDTDNLAAALKSHRDAVAAKLRIDDATPLVRWEYQQAKGEPAVVVRIERLAAPATFGATVMAEMLKPPETAPTRARCDFCRRLRPRSHMLLGSDNDDRHLLGLRGFNGKPHGTPWPSAMCLDDRETCERLSAGRGP